MRGIDPHDLPRFSDGLSYLYIEHCRVEKDDQAIAAVDTDGRIPIPVAALGALLLGPGTVLTHAAATALADTSCSVLWVGEHGVRLYASGVGIARRTGLLERQATLWATRKSRLQVARKLYELRFPGESLGNLSLQQLRGREGARVRRAYRDAAEQTGVLWQGRRYRPSQWEDTDPINQALSAATACMYGISHAAIVALGCSAGLGFIHTGTALAFVYDIADLYKADIAIPSAFEATATTSIGLERETRRRCRDRIKETSLLSRVVKGILTVLDAPQPRAQTAEEESSNDDTHLLWDPDQGTVEGGITYSDDSW